MQDARREQELHSGSEAQAGTLARAEGSHSSVLEYRKPRDEADSKGGAGAVLVAVLLLYGLFNLLAVLLAGNGYIHPPWGTLRFFTFVGPALGIVVTLAVQFGCKRRPFRPFLVAAIILALAGLGGVNWLILMIALAQV